MERLACRNAAQVHGDQEMQSIEVLAEESLRISEPPDGYTVGELDAEAAEPPPDWLEVEVTQVSPRSVRALIEAFARFCLASPHEL